MVGSLSPLVGDAQVVGSLSPLVFPRRGVVLANSRSARSMAHDGFAPPLEHCKRDTIVNSSGVDFVVVSTRAMCSTQVSLTRLLHFFNPRQIYYIVANGTDCDWLEAIDGRIKCMEESVVMPSGLMHELRQTCHFAACLGNKCPPVPGQPRPLGWYVQQFIKLGVSRWLPKLSARYVLFDADNVVRYGQQLFRKDGRVFLAENLYTAQGRYGYESIYERLTGESAPPTPRKKNWVVGYMCAVLRARNSCVAALT